MANKTLMLRTEELHTMATELLASAKGNPEHLRQRKLDVYHAIMEYLSAAYCQGFTDTHIIKPSLLPATTVSSHDYEQRRWQREGKIQ